MLYNLIHRFNQRLIMGDDINHSEKQNAVHEILSFKGLEGTCLKLQETGFTHTQAMQPSFFIPSSIERNKRLRLITGELPKTRILSDNSYELEVLRLVALWAGKQDIALNILRASEKRLEKTCFAHFCSKGECTGTSIAFLRFWSAYRPDDIQTQKTIINCLKPFRDGKGTWRNGLDIPVYYTYSAFGECSYEAVEEELQYSKDLLLNLLYKEWLNEPEALLRKHVVKNALSRIPEYSFVKDAKFNVGDDNRLHTSL